MRRVAYLWSDELMGVADELPANQGRSRLVHGLISALGLVDLNNVQEYNSSSPPPDSPADEDTNGHDSPGAPLTSAPEYEGAEAPGDAGGVVTNGHEEKPPTNVAEEGDTPAADSRIDTASEEGGNGVEVRALAPDPMLCEASELRRYHDASYVGEFPGSSHQLTTEYLLYGRGVDTDEEEDFAPRKRRRKDRSRKLGLEYVS